MKFPNQIELAGGITIGFLVFGVCFIAYRAITTYADPGEIVSIERSCDYTRTETHRTASSVSQQEIVTRRDCSGEWAFQQVRHDPRLLKNLAVVGTAIATMRYQIPGDRTWHEAKLEIPSHRIEFYTLQPGQKLTIRVNRWNPEVIGL